MRGARVAVLTLLLATPCLAGKVLERSATEVFAKMSVAAGALASMRGELEVSYAAAGPHAHDHRARFWFAKPFRLRVDEVPAGLELTCADQHAALYQPELKQVVDFELGSGAGGAAADILPRFFALFAIPSFVQGALLTDVESQFAIQVEEVDGGWKLRLEPHALSVYRTALAIDHVEAEVDGKSMLPRRLDIHDFGPDGAPRLLCAIRVESLEMNVRIAPLTFLVRPHPGVHHVASTEVLREWVLEALGRAGDQGRGVVDQLQQRIEKLRKDPWGF